MTDVVYASPLKITEETRDLNKIYIYRNLIDTQTRHTKKNLCNNFSMLFDKDFTPTKHPVPLSRILIVPIKNIAITFKKNDKIITEKCMIGDCIYYFNGITNLTMNDNLLLFYAFNLKEIFLNTNYREIYANIIKNEFLSVKSEKIFNQNIDNKISVIKKLGEGNYGSVFSAIGHDKKFPFAVKYGVIKEEGKDNYNEEISSYHEMLILQNILSPLVKNGVCPNLPLVYDVFISNQCRLTDTPVCIVSLLELADGDLRQWWTENKLTQDDYYSCMFQIMAGLHAVQNHAQIMNFDIKAENVLYFKIPKGGCWKYNILEKTFYVPNTGYLFVLNDFGLSRSMNPDLVLPKSSIEYLRLGSRFAIVQNGKFVPIKNLVGKEITWVNKENSFSSLYSGTEILMTKDTKKILKKQNNLSLKQQQYLEEVGIPTDYRNKEYYKHPMVIPPFEFYNDTMDVIRMFIGGKRTTQKKFHGGVPKTERNSPFISELEKYNFISESNKDRKFPVDAYYVLAGYFINDFYANKFQQKTEYIIQSYKI